MKKIILALGIAALISSPALANDLNTSLDQFTDTPDQFVSEPTDFTGEINQFDVTEPTGDVIEDDVNEGYDDGIVKQDVRLPRIDDPRFDNNRSQAYDVTDPNSIHSNQNVIDDDNGPRDVTVDTFGHGRKFEKSKNGVGAAVIKNRSPRDRQIRGYIYNK